MSTEIKFSTIIRSPEEIAFEIAHAEGTGLEARERAGIVVAKDDAKTESVSDVDATGFGGLTNLDPELVRRMAKVAGKAQVVVPELGDSRNRGPIYFKNGKSSAILRKT